MSTDIEAHGNYEAGAKNMLEEIIDLITYLLKEEIDVYWAQNIIQNHINGD